jgi:hypothetical protein
VEGVRLAGRAGGDGAALARGAGRGGRGVGGNGASLLSGGAAGRSAEGEVRGGMEHGSDDRGAEPEGGGTADEITPGEAAGDPGANQLVGGPRRRRLRIAILGADAGRGVDHHKSSSLRTRMPAIGA